MKKSIIVVLLAAALLGGCSKSDPAATAKGIDEHGNLTQNADCSKLNGLSLKPVKYQPAGAVLGWTHLRIDNGAVTSVPAPGMPSWQGSFTCKSSMFDGTKWLYTLGTNIGDVGITASGDEFESTVVRWQRKAVLGGGFDTIPNNYVGG
jgi:major membrane immunogen (membrane-anchored lipoprotein)